LSFAEVETESHITERGTFFHDVSAAGDNLEPAPAPRFSRSTVPTPTPPSEPGADTEAVLRDWV
jgi:alpha-methylacyl-CoA racemase